MLFATEFNYCGFTIEAATDKEGNYFISQGAIERLYDWTSDSGRKKYQSKSFKALVGESFEVGKISAVSQYGRYSEIYWESCPSSYFAKVVSHVNRKLFGVSNFKSNRTDNMTQEQQETIKNFEKLLVGLAKNNPSLDPWELVNRGIEIYHQIY